MTQQVNEETPATPGAADPGKLFSTRQLSRRERKAMQAPEKPSNKGRRKKKSTAEVEAGRLGPRGWRLPGGGRTVRVSPTPEFRGPTVQTCGLFPFVAGSSLPLIGTPLGEHLEGRGWVCGDPVSWFLYGMLNNPSAFVMARRGVGKALDLETLVPTPDGYARMGDLRPGDHVFGSDGRPTPVVAVSEVMGDRPCYEVQFTTGERIVADALHLWVTETKADRVAGPRTWREDLAAVASAREAFAGETGVRLSAILETLGWRGTHREAAVVAHAHGREAAGSCRPVGAGLYDPAGLLDAMDGWLRQLLDDQQACPDAAVKTTEQIADTLWHDGKWNHWIDAVGIEGVEQDLPVGPYTLGAWLGDAASCATSMAAGPPREVLDHIRTEGYDLHFTDSGYRPVVPGGRLRRFAPGFESQLRELRVLDNKHIPAVYLRASTWQRRQLLSGLLETSTVTGAGVLDENGVEFASSDQRFAEGVHELAASLGYRPHLWVGTGRWHVSFKPDANELGLTRLRKRREEGRPGASEETAADGDAHRRYIHAVRPVASRPVRCIQVANEDGMFLVGRSFIATHNSTLMRRIAEFAPYKGILPMILSDWKPDYVDLAREIDGQVLSLNRADSFVNPLDPGPVARLLPELPEDLRVKVEANIRGRRINVAVGLAALALGRDLETHERNMLSAALAAWDEDHPGEVPVFADVQSLVKSRDRRVRAQAQDRGDTDRYDDRAERLLDALNSLTGGDEIFGQVFANHTTEPLEIDRPVVFDLSAFEEMDPILQAGVQLVCWTYGSTALAAAKVLADAGLRPQRVYLLIMDELWRALRAAEFMVDRVDEITRLNRTIGLGQLLCTHGMDDLKLHNAEATAKAWGFVAASEMVYLGGLNPGEMGNLEEVFALSQTEKAQLTHWAQIGEPDPETGRGGEPLGKGKFMIKAGKRPGIPFKVTLTQIERESGIHDTSRTFNDAMTAAHREADPGTDLMDDYA